MVEWIKNWTEGIIIAVIVSIIIEMLIPEGKNKKYIKVVSGIYILYTIVNPFLGNTISFETEEISSKIFDNNIIQDTSNSIATDTYILSLEEYFKQKIIDLGYEVKEVNIICNFDYSEILEINIKMKSISYDVNSIKEIVLDGYEINENNIVVS